MEICLFNASVLVSNLLIKFTTLKFQLIYIIIPQEFFYYMTVNIQSARVPDNSLYVDADKPKYTHNDN